MSTWSASPKVSQPRCESNAKGNEMPHLHNHSHIHLGLWSLLNVYYFLKPAIPQAVRFALRHSYALPLRWAFANSWPVRQASSEMPRGWSGWPHGKSFAFVLTHDVEGSKGLERCRQLAELEMRLGFRSSFNFVPEGEYTMPRALRAFLEDHGFARLERRDDGVRGPQIDAYDLWHGQVSRASCGALAVDVCAVSGRVLGWPPPWVS